MSRATAGLSGFSADSSAQHGSAPRVRPVWNATLDLMTSDALCSDLIERYISTFEAGFLSDEHGGAYFCVPSAHHRRLHVHLEISPSFGDMLTIEVTPVRTFPDSDRPWLTHVADTWNRQNRDVTALLAGACDPQRVGVVARRSWWIRDDVSFEGFADLVDRTVAAAIDLFDELAPSFAEPAAALALLRDAG